ncbi:fimbrial protein [Serratia grimesii]|uniref:fimbrial protein n=1 Tax=Serratia grimesii TaxID=82995 RepID=UPI00223F39E4|nr:fimbrial protein [Serratia grimesii]
MKTIPLALLLSSLFSGYSYAACSDNSGIKLSAPISIDLSDKLSAQTPVWSLTLPTQYTGTFTCSGRGGTIGFFVPLEKNSIVMGFSNGKYLVNVAMQPLQSDSMEISDSKQHSASELNQNMNLTFSLVTDSGKNVSGDTFNISDTVIASDLTSLNLILWLLKQVGKIVQWVASLFQTWPYDNTDMFGQPLIIKYAPKLTTCSFDNAGLTVALPTQGISQILKNNKPGYTPFMLNFKCEQLAANNTATRAIDIFLSSNTLLSTDNSVMVDNTNGAAKGAGIRLVNVGQPDAPIVLSTSTASRNNATSLFNVQRGGSLTSSFSLSLAAFYFAYAPTDVSAGKINTTATLNIVYP